MQNRLSKRKLKKRAQYSCYKRIHKLSSTWEYIKINSDRFKCQSNNFTGVLPLVTRNYVFEYVGPWVRGKYDNIESDEAIKPPTIQIPKKEEEEITIPDSIIKPKRTRKTKPKADE